jgi:hypothetical protein
MSILFPKKPNFDVAHSLGEDRDWAIECRTGGSFQAARVRRRGQVGDTPSERLMHRPVWKQCQESL